MTLTDALCKAAELWPENFGSCGDTFIIRKTEHGHETNIGDLLLPDEQVTQDDADAILSAGPVALEWECTRWAVALWAWEMYLRQNETIVAEAMACEPSKRACAEAAVIAAVEWWEENCNS